jgi:2-polyprenyl-3-methyl-5-hydroxy-6-metoxy-1,4-benzoquinol methylase
VSYHTIDELRSQLGGAPAHSAEYVAKMMHPIPITTEVKREAFILSHCQGKRVLEFGASGPLHEAIVKVATFAMGVDRERAPGVVDFDLDDVSQSWLPSLSNVDIIVCGEVLEHLGNPQHFLARMKRQYAGVPVIITVPNAFSAVGHKWAAKNVENVNADHVAWYSPKTLSVLLQRAGYSVGALFWYGGSGPTADGLVVVTE